MMKAYVKRDHMLALNETAGKRPVSPMSVSGVRPESALASAGVRFVKMHGLGNDFVVIDRRYQSFTADADQIRAMADRHTGIGFDQLLLLDHPRDDGDVAYGIYNADGLAAEQCGNGLRCVALLFYETSAGRRREMALESPAGTVRARVRDDGLVTVEMGVPDFRPAALPFEATEQAPVYTIEAAGRSVEIRRGLHGQPPCGDPRRCGSRRAGDGARSRC